MMISRPAHFASLFIFNASQLQSVLISMLMVEILSEQLIVDVEVGKCEVKLRLCCALLKAIHVLA